MDYSPAVYLTLLLVIAVFAYEIAPREHKLKGWLGGMMIIIKRNILDALGETR